MEKREDRRITMTKRMLKDALIGMLKEKDIYHISIRELCERADINRTTFYKEKDILDFTAKAVQYNETDPEKIIYTVCCYVEENIEFIRLIINNNVDPSFAHKLFAMEVIKDSALKNYTDRSDAELEYIYNFLTYGAFRMVYVWLNKEEREPPEVFSRLISQIMLSSGGQPGNSEHR